jgi:hypothetical protein
MAAGDKAMVVTEAIRKEASKWSELSDAMGAVKANAGRLTLEESAFFCGDGISVSLAPVYNEFQQFMTAVFGQAQAEFGQLTGALKKSADRYDASDEDAVINLSEIYG